MTEEYTLEDLERLSGLPIRTLRFYIQEGLLPGPDTRGKYARYSGRHLASLELIQRLKNMRLPLQQIRRMLDDMTTDDLAQVLHAPNAEAPLRNLPPEKGQFFGKMDEDLPVSSERDPSARTGQLHSIIRDTSPQNYYLTTPAQPQSARSQPVQKTRTQTEETWQRIQLAEGVELQVRKPLDRQTLRLVDELRKFARRFIDERRWKDEDGIEQDY